MKKAYISVNYLFTLEPEEVDLSNDCSEEEFYNTVKEYMENATSNMDFLLEMEHNDLEIDIVEEV